MATYDFISVTHSSYGLALLPRYRQLLSEKHFLHLAQIGCWNSISFDPNPFKFSRHKAEPLVMNKFDLNLLFVIVAKIGVIVLKKNQKST